MDLLIYNFLFDHELILLPTPINKYQLEICKSEFPNRLM